MHPETHPLTYGADSRSRIAKLGPTQLSTFLAAISKGRVQPWLSALPKLDGFRPNSPAASNEQRKRLVGRLTSSESKLAHETDWHVLKHLWIAWTDEAFRGLELPNVIQAIEDGDETDGIDPLERVETSCRNIISERKTDREQLRTFFAFSPFPSTEAISAIVASAPASSELARMRFIDSLPEAITALEGRLQELAAKEAAGGHVDQSLEEVTARLGELTGLVSSLSSETSAVQKAIANTTEHYNVAAERVGVAETRLAALEERLLTFEMRDQRRHNELMAALTANVPGPADDADSVQSSASSDRDQKTNTHIDNPIAILADRLSKAATAAIESYESQKLLMTTAERLDELTKRFDLSDGRRVAEMPSDRPRDSVTWTHMSQSAHGHFPNAVVNHLSAFTSWNAVRDSMEHNLRQIGLISDHAACVANEVTMGIANAQPVTFAGSLGLIVASACSRTFLQPTVLFVVPFGFVGTIERPTSEHRTPVLLLSGVNRSAFEMYGDELTSGLFNNPARPLGSNAPVLIATFLDGAGTLPLAESYADLGPIIETDTLVYRQAMHDLPSFEAAVLDRELIDSERELSDLEELEELLSIPKLLKPVPSVLFEKTFYSAASFALETLKMPKASAAGSLVASWVVPRLRCGAMSVKNLKESLAGSPWADVLSDSRFKKALTRVGP